MNTTLPPVPDLLGDPRPPAGPAVAGSQGALPRVSSTHCPGGKYSTGHSAYVGGDTFYPMLEKAALMRRPSLWLVVGVAAGAVALPAVVLVVGLLWTTGAVTIPVAIVIGVMFLWVAGGVLLEGDAPIVEVGARGISDHRPSDVMEGSVVDLYLLNDVAIRDGNDGPELALSQWLSMLSRAVEVVVPCALLDGNPELWALVYNGIRHSEARGASIDERTRELLQLPPVGKTPPRDSAPESGFGENVEESRDE